MLFGGNFIAAQVGTNVLKVFNKIFFFSRIEKSYMYSASIDSPCIKFTHFLEVEFKDF